MGPYTKEFCDKSPGVGKKWHPGVLGHKLRADVISFAILSILDETTSKIIRAIDSDYIYESSTHSIDESLQVPVHGKVMQLMQEALNTLNVKEELRVDPSMHAQNSGRGRHQRRRQLSLANNPPPLSCLVLGCDSAPSCFTGVYLSDKCVSC
jgi:hypothetical protein